MVRVLSRSGVEGTLLLRVLVDAAVLYTLTLFVLLTCYAFQNIGQLIVLDMVRLPIPESRSRHDLADAVFR